MISPRVLAAAFGLALAACAPAADESAARPTLAQSAPAAVPGRVPVPTATPVAAADGAPNRVLDPASFDDPATRTAYAAAREYAHVLEGIYCYCHCKENIAHRALSECFESDHATGCDICQREALIAARMAAAGKATAEIQKAIDAYYTA